MASVARLSLDEEGIRNVGLAVPRTDAEPLVFDMATNATACVNIVQASIETRSIPLGWALVAEGNPTDDPRLALAGTVLREQIDAVGRH